MGVAAQAKAEAAAAGKDADFCDGEGALAVPGELTKAVAQEASGAARGRCWADDYKSYKCKGRGKDKQKVTPTTTTTTKAPRNQGEL